MWWTGGGGGSGSGGNLAQGLFVLSVFWEGDGTSCLFFSCEEERRDWSDSDRQAQQSVEVYE